MLHLSSAPLMELFWSPSSPNQLLIWLFVCLCLFVCLFCFVFHPGVLFVTACDLSNFIFSSSSNYAKVREWSLFKSEWMADLRGNTKKKTVKTRWTWIFIINWRPRNTNVLFHQRPLFHDFYHKISKFLALRGHFFLKKSLSWNMQTWTSAKTWRYFQWMPLFLIAYSKKVLRFMEPPQTTP